jgi:hypothetical protein
VGAGDIDHGHARDDQGSLIDPNGLFTDAERRLAHDLVAEGHVVEALPTATIRRADARLCGTEVEFKTLRPGASAATVKHALKRAKGQAPQVILDARHSGLEPSEADRGVRAHLGTPYRKVEVLRIIGDGFDMTYGRGRVRAIVAELERRRDERHL